MNSSKHNRNVKSLYENIFATSNTQSLLSPKLSNFNNSRNSAFEPLIFQGFYSTHFSSPLSNTNQFTQSNSLNRLVASITQIDKTILPNISKLSSTYRNDFQKRIQPRKNASQATLSKSKNSSTLPARSFLENQKQETRQLVQQSKLQINQEKFKLATESTSNAQLKLQKFIKQNQPNQPNEQLTLQTSKSTQGKRVSIEPKHESPKQKIELQLSIKQSPKPKPQTPPKLELGSPIKELEQIQPESIQTMKEVAKRFFTNPKQPQVQSSIFSLVLSQEFKKLKQDSGENVKQMDLIVCENLLFEPKQNNHRKKKRLLTSKVKYFLTEINKSSKENVSFKEKAFLRKINQIFMGNYIKQLKTDYVEEFNLDTSLLSDGEKEVKFIQQQCIHNKNIYIYQAIKPQFRMTLLNQISVIPQKQQTDLHLGQIRNESPLNALVEALNNDKNKIPPTQKIKPGEKKVMFKTKKQIMVHLWPPGKDKITATYNIPDYYQFLPDKQSLSEREEEQVEHEYLSKPKNVFKQAIQSLISNSKNRAKQASSVLKIAGFHDEKTDQNLDEFQNSQKFSEEKVLNIIILLNKVKRYAKLYLQSKIQKIFERNEQSCLVLLQFMTEKKSIQMIISSQDVSKIQSQTTLLNYTKYETGQGLQQKLQNNEIIKMPLANLSVLKLDGLTLLLKKMYFLERGLETESPKPKGINDSISPNRKTETFIQFQSQYQQNVAYQCKFVQYYQIASHTLVSIQQQDEVESDSLNASELIQSSSQIEIQNKAQQNFVNDLPANIKRGLHINQIFQILANDKFLEKSSVLQYEIIVIGSRLIQPDWRTNTIQVIVSCLEDSTRNYMLSQKIKSYEDQLIIIIRVFGFQINILEEVRFRDVNVFLNKLDGKCREIQLLNIYDSYKAILTGDFEDEQELRCISQEIDFVEEEEQLIDEKVCSLASISYRRNQTQNIQNLHVAKSKLQITIPQVETQSTITLDVKQASNVEKNSPQKARISRLKTMFKGYSNQAKVMLQPQPTSNHQNSSTNSITQNNIKLSPSPISRKRELVVSQAVRKILKKSTLMDSLQPNTMETLQKRGDSPNELQVSNEESTSQKVLAKFEDTNTTESQDKMKQEKKEQTIIQQVPQEKSQNHIKEEKIRKQSQFLSSKINRNFEKNQSMAKYSFKMRTQIQEATRRKDKNLMELICLFIVENKPIEVLFKLNQCLVN